MRVQQKLSHSRFCLETLAGQSGLDRQCREALIQAAVVHLSVAVRLYLRELAGVAGVVNVERIGSLEECQHQIQSIGQVSMAVEELARQEWLESLLRAEQGVLNPRLTEDSSLNSGLIPVGVPVIDVPPDAEMATRWQTLLDELIDRQRQSQVEY